MPKIDHPNIGDVAKSKYLTGVIISIDSEDDTCVVALAGLGNVEAIVFYHCAGTSTARTNGALEGGSAAFAADDEVIVIEKEGSYKVLGHADGMKRPCEIPWEVMVELDTEGIIDFPNTYPGEQVSFIVNSNLPTAGTFLYRINFLDGVVVSEIWNFAPFGAFTPEDFRMGGSYDAITKTYSFKAPSGTSVESGEKFWLSVTTTNTVPTRSNLGDNTVQHPFQFTVGGATNGFQQTTHLFDKPEKDLIIKMPYLLRTDVGEEEKSILTDWVEVPPDLNNDVSAGDTDVGWKTFEVLRASQPFQRDAKWRAGLLSGVLITQPNGQALAQGDARWSLIVSIFKTEYPACFSVGPPFELPTPNTPAGEIINSPVPTDAGNGTSVNYDATPPNQTRHEVGSVITNTFEGSGKATCQAFVTPPNGDFNDTDGYRVDNNLRPPLAADYIWKRWQEL